MTNPDKKFPVIEIFGPTIQGEGAMCGHVSHFIRLGGCSYRCTWCDTMYAVDPEQVKKNSTMMTAQRIADEVKDLNKGRKSNWVTLSGGDPAMWPLERLVWMLHMNLGLRIAIETQGAHWMPWIQYLEQITVSPKGPSSGERDKLSLPMLDKYEKYCGERMCFKIPVFGEADFEFAQTIHKRYPNVKMYLTAGTPPFEEEENVEPHRLLRKVRKNLEALAEETLRCPDMRDVVVLPQLHVLIWGRSRSR